MESLPIRENYLPFGRPDFGEEEIAAVTRVLRSGWIGMGPETIAFEQELSSVVGAPQVVAVSSCTAAMSLCLLLKAGRFLP
jgi:perosamine synthetase